MKTGEVPLQTELAREIALQIELLLDAGIAITHIDGHQHVHVFPSTLRTVAETARSHGIRRMRIPDETIPSGDETVPADLLEEVHRFGSLGRDARRFLAGTGIVSSDHFRGLALKGRLDTEGLLKLLETLPGGITELMVHPGRLPAEVPFSAFSSFSSPDRERELESILDPRFRLALDRAGVVLVSFREICS
jgi:predicted glycoside hydrolase/deacetylase ChbG (UPF0249 family)